MEDLNRVALFVRVAEAGSFTAASAALGLPQSSVSRSVLQLEDELGVRLLQRTTRKLGLTDAGRAYFERARTVLADLEEATVVATEMGQEPRGTVRITAPVDAGTTLLAEVGRAGCSRAPKARRPSRSPAIRAPGALRSGADP